MPTKSGHGQGAQRHNAVLICLILFIAVSTAGWFIHRTRTIARQTSHAWASAAMTASNAGIYDRAMRFAILAMDKAGSCRRVWPIRWLMQNRGRSLAKAVCNDKLAGANRITTGDEAASAPARGRLAESVCGS